MKSKNLITLCKPHSLETESYKLFRTYLDHMTCEQDHKVILFTSTKTDEGKTTSISNTAISIAQTGKKVLLVECDLRKASIHLIFNIPQGPGLTNLLSGRAILSDVVQPMKEFTNLHILTSGPIPPNPSELLATQTFKNMIKEARIKYDMVLIDAPPVLSVSDTSIISKLVDGVILIMAYKETTKDAAKNAKKALEQVGANILGVLMTKGEPKKSNAYAYYNGLMKKKKNRLSFQLVRQAKSEEEVYRLAVLADGVQDVKRA